MNTLINLKNNFIGSLTALTLVAAVACSGSIEPAENLVATKSNTEQVSNVAVSTETITSTNTAESDDTEDSPTPTIEAIQSTSDDDGDDRTIGDAIVEAPAPAPEVIELTPAEIVADIPKVSVSV